MTKSPNAIQHWVDMIPPAHIVPLTTIHMSPLKSTYLTRDASIQSDDASSHCSSLESVLELRRPDPEAVLIGLGFGPTKTVSSVSRIPLRFLQPSKLIAHIDINKFLEEQGEMQIPESQCKAVSSSPPVAAKNMSV